MICTAMSASGAGIGMVHTVEMRPIRPDRDVSRGACPAAEVLVATPFSAVPRFVLPTPLTLGTPAQASALHLSQINDIIIVRYINLPHNDSELRDGNRIGGFL